MNEKAIVYIDAFFHCKFPIELIEIIASYYCEEWKPQWQMSGIVPLIDHALKNSTVVSRNVQNRGVSFRLIPGENCMYISSGNLIFKVNKSNTLTHVGTAKKRFVHLWYIGFNSFLTSYNSMRIFDIDTQSNSIYHYFSNVNICDAAFYNGCTIISSAINTITWATNNFNKPTEIFPLANQRIMWMSYKYVALCDDNFIHLYDTKKHIISRKINVESKMHIPISIYNKVFIMKKTKVVDDIANTDFYTMLEKDGKLINASLDDSTSRRSACIGSTNDYAAPYYSIKSNYSAIYHGRTIPMILVNQNKHVIFVTIRNIYEMDIKTKQITEIFRSSTVILDVMFTDRVYVMTKSSNQFLLHII